MNITKRDVLELRRRLKKNECTFSRLCGCYVNGSKNVVLKFGQPFLDLADQEFFKYLEIAKKTLSGTLGNNLLELPFQRTEEGQTRQQFLLTLKGSKLQNDALLDRLYEQIIEQYAYAGNYLILVFHDVYDVITRTSDRAKLDESEEIYEYLLCAVCPVELSKPGLGYREDENRIGTVEQDWVVGLPDLGFVYPAFADRGSDVNAVLYYVKNPRESRASFVTGVLGCEPQRTAAEEKTTFHEIVKDAFGEQEEQAGAAFLRIQKNLNGIVAEQPEDVAPFCLTPAAVCDVIADIAAPAPVKEQIERAYAAEFGEAPPPAQNLLDSKLVAASAQIDRAIDLEAQVFELKQQLEQAAVTPPEQGGIVLQVPEDKAGHIRAQIIDGQTCLIIPVEQGEPAYINGAPIATTAAGD